MIRLILVDDQNSIKEFLKMRLEKIPEISIVGFASNGKEAVALVEKLEPDVVLMDLEMPHMNGIEATKIISAGSSKAKILLLTTRNEKQLLDLARQAGASGYIFKSADAGDLGDVIHLASKGYYQFGPFLNKHAESEAAGDLALTIPRNSSSQVTNSEVYGSLANTVADLADLTKKISLISDRYAHNVYYEKKRFFKSSNQKNLPKRRQNLKQYLIFIFGVFLGIFATAIILSLWEI
jgi:DNA-binding NarL/FixJ family response regulator